MAPGPREKKLNADGCYSNLDERESRHSHIGREGRQERMSSKGMSVSEYTRGGGTLYERK